MEFLKKILNWQNAFYNAFGTISPTSLSRFVLSTIIACSTAIFFTVGLQWSKLAYNVSLLNNIFNSRILDPLILQGLSALFLAVYITIFIIVHPVPLVKKKHIIISFTSQLIKSLLMICLFMGMLSAIVQLLKVAYDLKRPIIQMTDISDHLMRATINDSNDLPSGYTFRQIIIFLTSIITIKALLYNKLIQSNAAKVLITITAIVSIIVIFSRVITGHHSPLGVAAGLFWGVSAFWLIILILPTRRHVGFHLWELKVLAIWTIFSLLALATQGNPFGGMVVMLFAGIMWGAVYLAFPKDDDFHSICKNRYPKNKSDYFHEEH